MRRPGADPGPRDATRAAAGNLSDNQSVILAVPPGDQPEVGTLPVRSVGPRYTDWLPGLLEDLLPVVERTVRELSIEAVLEPDGGDWSTIRAGRLEWRLVEQLAPAALEGAGQYDAEAAMYGYVRAAVRMALRGRDDVEEPVRRALTTIGSGSGPWNAGLAALRVVASLLANAPKRPTVRAYLDADAWTSLEDRSTGQRALTVLTVLSTAVDVELVVSSPGVRRALTSRYDRWLNAHLDLTEQLDGWGVRAESDTPGGASAEQRAFDTLASISDGDGRLRIIKNLPRSGSREVRMLRRDPEIELAESSIDVYVSALEADGLVDVNRSRRYNRVSLTAAGRTAREYVTADYEVRNPRQTMLETFVEVPPESGSRLTETPQASAGTVYGASATRKGGTGGGRRPSGTPESVLANTGNPVETGDYARWLPGAGDLSPWAMHQRITAGCRGPGVNLVDDNIRRWGRDGDPDSDGRVTYISCFDDEFLLLAQWGGVLPTQARIAGALLSDRALSKVLTPDAVGEEFEQLFDGSIEEISDDAMDVVRFGIQMGWIGDDETDWDGWRKRYGSVKAFLLSEVKEVVGTDDQDRRGRVMEDLHGLITAATSLYYAAGIDVVVNLRVPDLYELRRDEQRENDFLNFLRYTVTKQTAYKCHSGYRMLLEDRPEKLKYRLEYSDDLDPSDITMDTTADWIISGPTMTSLQGEIEAALEAERHELREAVEEGVEQAAVMEIPVRNANSYAAIRAVIREFSKLKGYQDPEYAARTSSARDSIDRLTRVFIQSLCSEGQPGRCCPHDVAEALLRISKADRWTSLDVDDVGYGLSQLPPDRAFKMLTPSMTKVLQELLVADGPIGRGELVERASISTDTYDRNIDEMAALDLVEPRDVDGYRRWEAHIEPWWQPQHDRSQPFSEDTETGCWPAPKEQDLVAELVYELDLDVDDELLTMVTRSKLERLYDQSRVLQRWRGFIRSAVASGDEMKRGPPDLAAVIGRLPPGAEAEQLRLSTSPAAAAVAGRTSSDAGKSTDASGAGYE